jgi:acetyltransferase
MVGVTDASFGPVITFGAGGIAVEVMQDRALSLPPVNHYLVERMIDKTRIGKILGPFKNMPGIDMEALKNIVLHVSELVCELPEVREMDINPLMADESGVVALDARIIVQPQPQGKPYGHMAIMPYPVHIVHCAMLKDGTTVMIRPVRPEDAQMQQEFVRNLSRKPLQPLHVSISSCRRACWCASPSSDYDREMALAMVRQTDDGEEAAGGGALHYRPRQRELRICAGGWPTRGRARHRRDPDAGAVRRGARAGLKTMVGEVLAGNKGMLKLMARLGFVVTTHPEDRALTIVTKDLQGEATVKSLQ